MKRPSNDAWFEKQKCGPFFVYFTVSVEDGDASVEWQICPDDEDKSEERAIAASDGDIHGPKDQLDALIERAMREARDAAIGIARTILTWADDTGTKEA